VRECAEKCRELEVSCPVYDCRLWVDYDDDLNCTLITVDKRGRMTLRETSERLGVSFVRVKQIQDKALQKLLKKAEFEEIRSFFDL